MGKRKQHPLLRKEQRELRKWIPGIPETHCEWTEVPSDLLANKIYLPMLILSIYVDVLYVYIYTYIYIYIY